MAITDPRDISGLLAWYSAEAETYADGAQVTQWTDLSGLGNHATAVAGGSGDKPLFRTTAGASSGPAIEFTNSGTNNGTAVNEAITGGHFQLPASLMGSSTAGEIAATVKRGTSAYTGIWSLGAIGAGYDGSDYPFGGSAVSEGFGLNGAGQRQSFTASLSLDAWRRYNVYSASGDWQAFLDSTSQATYASGTVAWNAAPLLGASSGDTSAVYLRFQGYMGAVVIYSRKLTTGERSDLDAWLVAHPSGGALPPSGTPTATIPALTGTLTGTYVPPAATYASEVLTDAPSVYYPMGEGSGAALVDSSGNAYDGAYTGTPTWVTGLVPSDPAQSVDFDPGDYGQAPYGTWESPANFSVEFVVKPDVVTSGALVARHSAGGCLWEISFAASGLLGFTTRPSGFVTLPSSTTFGVGVTRHVVCTWDGTWKRIYVDGVLDASSSTDGIGANVDARISIGSLQGGYAGAWLDGKIGHVAFYNTALSGARIAAHHAAIAASDPAGTLAATIPALTAALAGTAPLMPRNGVLAATIPALAANLTGTSGAGDPSGTPTATIPALTGTLAGTYVPPAVTGSLVATLPALTASLSNVTFRTGTLAAAIPALTASLAGAVGWTDGDLTWSDDGYNYSGVARVYYDPPVVEPVASLAAARVKVKRVHVTMPTPTLVDGRPT